ncbi:hypothetical protein NDQ53_01890 [Rossellomorea marisflavi]|uniref:hypothetical protein n=1 Tax=Rossellomorea marisflavi TaxID=189381 RepID=UPI00203B3AF2|nr:hypothetical protein [Rossellomorea marisflavi]MCM2588053.1 hypothetical protein [Rossellomorea marisflavi]
MNRKFSLNGKKYKEKVSGKVMMILGFGLFLVAGLFVMMDQPVYASSGFMFGLGLLFVSNFFRVKKVG